MTSPRSSGEDDSQALRQLIPGAILERQAVPVHCASRGPVGAKSRGIRLPRRPDQN